MATHHAADEDYDSHRVTLERNIAASKSLLRDLHSQLSTTPDGFKRAEIEVNISDVTKQLEGWEYELSGWTHGRE